MMTSLILQFCWWVFIFIGWKVWTGPLGSSDKCCVWKDQEKSTQEWEKHDESNISTKSKWSLKKEYMHTAQAYGQDVHREEGGRAGDVHSLGRHHHQVPGGHHHCHKSLQMVNWNVSWDKLWIIGFINNNNTNSKKQQQEFARLVGVVVSLMSGPTHSSFPTETSSSLSPNGNSLPIQEHNPIFCNGKFHDREKL